MIGIPKTGGLANASLSAVCFEGLLASTIEGRPASLAIIDEDGKVIEAGPHVAREAWGVMMACWKQFLAGEGHIRVHSGPPDGPTLQ